MSIFQRNRKGASKGATGLVFGLPTRCPACEKPGYLDRIDLVDRVMFQHCPWCLTNWQVSEADIAARQPARSNR